MKITQKCAHFLHLAHRSCTVIHFKPEHQPVLHTAGHLVEELRTLLLSLGVQDTGL